MKSATVAGVLAALLRDGGSLAYASAALLGAPYFLRRKRRLLQKGRSESEFDMAHWHLRWDDANAAAPRETKPGNDAATAGPRVAFMLASWGEVETMKPLIHALRRECPAVRVILSVRRREAIAAARALADEEVLPFPFDSPLAIARWHARARPDLVAFFEEFNYPTLTRSLWVGHVPFIVIRARVDDSHGLGYRRKLDDDRFRRWQLRGLRAMLLVTESQRALIENAVPAEAQLKVVGSLKFPNERPKLAPEREAALRVWIEVSTSGAPLLVAGSTRATEETFVLDALEIVRHNTKGAAPVTLLAPRHLERVEEVAQLLRDRGVTFSRRSQPTSGPVEVLLLDTLGELGVAYGRSVAAFVGGTINGASHNVAEPLVWGIPTSYGPVRGNFELEQRLCEAAGVGFRVETPAQLAAHWTELLEAPELRDELSGKALALVESQRGAFARSLQALVEAVAEAR